MQISDIDYGTGDVAVDIANLQKVMEMVDKLL